MSCSLGQLVSPVEGFPHLQRFKAINCQLGHWKRKETNIFNRPGVAGAVL